MRDVPINLFALPRSGNHYVFRLFQVNYEERLVRAGGNPHLLTKDGVDKDGQSNVRNALLVTKNPYAWLVSFHRFVCGHRDLHKYKTPIIFSEFLTAERDYGMKFVGTPLEHWNFVQHTWLHLKPLLNFQHVRYEDALAQEEATCAGVASAFGLTRKDAEWENVRQEVASSGKLMDRVFDPTWYTEREYLEVYTVDDRAYISDHLDGRVLGALRYRREAA